MKRLAIFAAASLFLGCATVGPAAYGPADSKGFGYEESRIELDRYRITYRGSGDMPPDIVEDYARRRAAEITLAEGYDWFRVVGRDVAGEQRGGVGVGAGLGTGSYGRRSAVGVGVSGDLGTIGGRDYFTVRLEVLLGKGDRSDSGDYYDARDVAERFAPEPE